MVVLSVPRSFVDSISKEWLRIILDENEISFQSVRTWKESKDPKFEKKKARIERLTRKKHNPPVVLSFDKMGPFSLIPHGGRGWFERNDPQKIPANYHKYEGVRYEYICLNVYHQMLSIKQHEHKGGDPCLEFLKNQRSKYPLDQRIYVIQDGLPAHTPDIQRWARRCRVTLVPTATNASWMNPVRVIDFYGGR